MKYERRHNERLYLAIEKARPGLIENYLELKISKLSHDFCEKIFDKNGNSLL